MDAHEKCRIMLDFMLNSEREAAAAFVDSLLAEGANAQFIIQEILDPALVRQGIMWGQGSVSLAQAYVAAKIAEDALIRCAPAVADGAIVRRRGTIIVGNTEDDFHSLGRKIVATFLKANGWEVYDLGNDVLAEDFVDAAVRHNAGIIGVSAMMYTTALNIRKIRDCLQKRRLSGRIKLAAGGAVFNGRTDLVAEVGADGTAANAYEAVLLMDRLLHHAVEVEKK
jgi:methylmalonyl-CoA mutase cobalamin-binding domain/chain